MLSFATAPPACGSDQFACRTVCISIDWVCDEDEDCFDGKDEENCTSMSKCKHKAFCCSCMCNTIADGKWPCACHVVPIMIATCSCYRSVQRMPIVWVSVPKWFLHSWRLEVWWREGLFSRWWRKGLSCWLVTIPCCLSAHIASTTINNPVTANEYIPISFVLNLFSQQPTALILSLNAALLDSVSARTGSVMGSTSAATSQMNLHLVVCGHAKQQSYYSCHCICSSNARLLCFGYHSIPSHKCLALRPIYLHPYSSV